MEYVLALLLLGALVAVVVIRPLLAGDAASTHEADLRAELEAAKEAKYREIRDVQLDHATGKLSEEDFRRTDAELRAQAIAILKRLDELS